MYIRDGGSGRRGGTHIKGVRSSRKVLMVDLRTMLNGGFKKDVMFEWWKMLRLNLHVMPPKKLLESGVSTSYSFFCLFCTIHSELKYFLIFACLRVEI